MVSEKQKQIELLAPAGSLESFFAAIENGADAVFCGLTSFSARAKAKNFSLREIGQLSAYAHSQKKKIYVALNTLIKDREFPLLIEILQELERVSVDGLIVQDLGLYRLAHNHFRGIPLHASTQMVIHNLAGVRMLEKLGFARAVLARELSLDEITFIDKNSRLELEHFVHGALCYSVSGHCLFSSYLDGRSGNRGRCIQPCRRRYHHKQNSGFYFSTSDFSAIELVPKLERAGVMSFKIEGRMKSAEYVASVVAAYRIVLDAEAGKEKDAILAAREKLENCMGRQSSSGFLPGFGGKGIVLPKQKGGIGKIIAKVERLQGRSVIFKTGELIHVGDRLRIQPGNDRAGQGFTVRKMYLGRRAVKRAGKGSRVSIPLPFSGKVSVGDLVFKLATGKIFTMSKEACQRKLMTAAVHSHSVELTILCEEKTFCVTASVYGMEMKKKYSVEMIVANKSPLTRETLLKVFSHTGYPELSLMSFDAVDLPPVVIKPSRLKEIRRDFYGHLNAFVAKRCRKLAEKRLQQVQETILIPKGKRQKTAGEILWIVTDQCQDVKAVSGNTAYRFIFPLMREMFEATKKYVWEEKELECVIWDIPSLLFDCDWDAIKVLIEKTIEAGFFRFRLNNLAHFELFSSYPGVHLMVGPWLYSLNHQAIDALQDLNIREWTLSIEDDKENIGDLLNSNLADKLLVTVFSPVDLFTSRIAPPLKEKEYSLQNDKGDLLHVQAGSGLTITRSDNYFSLLGKLWQLRKMSCSNFILDLRSIGFLTSKGQEVFDAFDGDCYLPGTTEFNYERGLA